MKLILWLLGLAYFFSPYDFFPDLIAGWGWIDDLLLAGFLWWFYRRHSRLSRQQFQHQAFDEESKAHGPEPPQEEPRPPRTPYETLGVSRAASPEEIRRAYRRLVARYHPDKVQHLGEEFQRLAERKFMEIQEAYRQLTT